MTRYEKEAGATKKARQCVGTDMPIRCAPESHRWPACGSVASGCQNAVVDTTTTANSGGRTRTGDLKVMTLPSFQLLYPASLSCTFLLATRIAHALRPRLGALIRKSPPPGSPQAVLASMLDQVRAVCPVTQFLPRLAALLLGLAWRSRIRRLRLRFPAKHRRASEFKP